MILRVDVTWTTKEIKHQQKSNKRNGPATRLQNISESGKQFQENFEITHIWS